MGKKILFSFVGLLLLVAVVVWFSNRGYGKVSDDSWQVAKAICGACMEKSETRIEKVEALLADPAGELEISDQERLWLQQMIDKGKDGQWGVAAKWARQMMKEQVDFP